MSKTFMELSSILYSICGFLLISLVVLMLSACSPLTAIHHNVQTTYKPEYNVFNSPIAKPYEEELKGKEDGALIIADGAGALLHRLAFVQMAQKSIDIQTYIYKNELTSHLLLHELYEAANRGVKIRILIDDNGISSDFYDLILLDNHKNIEVRIFNAYFFRFFPFRAFEAIFDFNRISKRMHNKLFVFDETALIVGGRNIADEYFDNASVNFTDTDLLFIGNVAKDAKYNFEQFWNYKRSIPVSLFPSKRKLKKYNKKQLKEQQKQKYDITDKDWQEYVHDVEALKHKYLHKEFNIAWGNGIFLADLPEKIDDNSSNLITTPILDTLIYNLNRAKHSIVISSSYLVPGAATMDIWKEFMDRGVQIKILTNSLAATDIVPVYSHWENYRDKLVTMGVDVYEFPSLESKKARLRDKAKFYNSSKGRVSLHSKSMIIDDSIVAVGSFNLDYRSAMLNTESIVFFQNTQLATELRKIIEQQMQESYKILYNPKTKKTYWELHDDSETQTFTKPPHATIWLKLYKTFAKIIPEKLL